MVPLSMLLMHYRKSGSITIEVCYQMVPVLSGRPVALFLIELRVQRVWVRDGQARPEPVRLGRTGP